MDLFSAQTDQKSQPLAYRMRPRTLDEYIGQDHIVGKGRLLRRAIQADQLSSLIFYGPPGTGKTTLARVIANSTKSSFVTMNAVLSGVKQLREEIDKAKERLDFHSRRTILFIDEVHRWNKSQQDALLPWVENGTVILIGATTENPYFEVNPALVSRSRIFQLKTLTQENLAAIAQQAISDKERGYGKFRILFDKDAMEHLVSVANGDARSLLNAIELAVETTVPDFPPPEATEIHITKATAEESIQKKAVLYDKEGDYHYDVISAFIKSIRGSDPDAVLYWLARMIDAGEDPRFIFRRMLISASEDIGLADPEALGMVEAAASAFDRVGLPEGRFHLTQAALYLATAPKSNSTLGFFDALKAIEEEKDNEVPNHLRDASRDKKGFGHGEGYLYPHAYRDHWVAQQYLPAGLQGKILYKPSEQGYEREIRDTVVRRREAQLEAAAFDTTPAETLTFSPPDKSKERWMQRLISGKGDILSQIRDTMFKQVNAKRHDRILVLQTGNGMLLWEACRLTPEGGVVGITDNTSAYETIQHYAMQLTEPERPLLYQGALQEVLQTIEKEFQFEAIIGRNIFTRLRTAKPLIPAILSCCVPGGTIVLAETVPSKGYRLSSIIPAALHEVKQLVEAAEKTIYNDPDNPLTNWTEDDLLAAFFEYGITKQTFETQYYGEQRIILPQDLERWIGTTYAKPLDVLGCSEKQKSEILQALIKALGNSIVTWKSAICTVRMEKEKAE